MPAKFHCGVVPVNSGTGTYLLPGPVGFGTPTGVWMFVLPSAGIERSIESGASLTVASCAPSNLWAIGSSGGDASIATRRVQTDDAAVRFNVLDASGTSTQFMSARPYPGDGGGPVVDGWNVNVNFLTQPAVIAYCLVGDVELENFALDNTEGVTTASFPPDAIWSMCAAIEGGGNLTNSVWAGGFAEAINDTNRVLLSFDANGVATIDAGTVVLNTDMTGVLFLGTTETFRTRAENFGPTGFDAVQTGAFSNADYRTTLMRSADDDFFVGEVAAPTSTVSDWVVTGIGFKPKMAMLIPSFNDGFFNPERGTIDSGTIGYCIQTADNAISVCSSSQSGVAGGERKRAFANQWIYVLRGGSTVAYDLAPSSDPFTNDGWIVPAADIAAALPQAATWICLAIGESGAPPPPGYVTQMVV